jgi:Na+/H+ antiporter NhaD/arsenite permease-like protein
MMLAAGAALLTTFAPILKNWLSDDNDKIADKAVDIAQAITGTSNITEAIKSLTQNDHLAATFSEQVTRQSAHFEALLADRSDARENYKNSHKQADRMADRIMVLNLPVALVVVVAQGAATYFLKDNPTLLSTTTAAFTWLIKHLLDERKEVTGFYFGGALSRDNQKK